MKHEAKQFLFAARTKLTRDTHATITRKKPLYVALCVSG